MKNIISTLEEILKIHSPTGYTIEIINYIENLFKGFNVITKKTNKGSLLISFDQDPELVISGHVDTLGAMVKEINEDGTLAITKLGGLVLTSFEGEYVTIRNYNGELFRGTFLLNNPAAHVNKDVESSKRKLENMSVRLDELVADEIDVKKLGIDVGDFVFFDNRFEYTSSGFVKSRFLDDKACTAIMVELVKELNSKSFSGKVGFYFSNYEEVGHGACAGIPDSAKDLLVLDMAVIGEGCSGKEDGVSICIKDSTGPYDFEMTSLLREIAIKNGINFVTDIYPLYGSDGSAALTAGYDIRVSLIGPGVSASHGVERTHVKALEETYKLTKLYIENCI